MNYQIVVFKNKTQKRIINKFNTSKKALEYFESHLTENEKVPFEVRTENGNECKLSRVNSSFIEMQHSTDHNSDLNH